MLFTNAELKAKHFKRGNWLQLFSSNRCWLYLFQSPEFEELHSDSDSDSDSDFDRQMKISHVTVCDINPAMLEVGQRKARELGHHEGTVIRGSDVWKQSFSASEHICSKSGILGTNFHCTIFLCRARL